MYGYEGKLFEFDNWFIREQRSFGYGRLVQICELALEQGGRIYRHNQMCHEISCIISGEGSFYSDGKAIPVSRGSLHVVSQGQDHEIAAHPTQRLRYVCIGFHLDAGCKETPRGLEAFYRAAPAYAARDNGEIRTLFDMLIHEFYERGGIEEQAVDSLVRCILIKTRRFFQAEEENRIRRSGGGAGIGPTVYKVIRYVDGNIYGVKTVREIAAALSFTENYLSHLFRERMGITLQAYIRTRKMEAAKGLLTTEGHTVSEIAAILGFASSQSFCRAFKGETGVSPTEFRKHR